MTRPGDRLRTKLALGYPPFRSHAEHLWHGPNVRLLYPIYLRTMHMIVRSAVPLMETAIESARLRGTHDKLAVALVEYFTQHIEEERGHDAWLLEDFEATGGDRRDVVGRIPPPSVAGLVGAQYYWIRHHHPVALLGHIAAIECHHPPTGFARQLAAQTGYPPSAFRAIQRHEVLDIAHSRELFQLVDTLPLEASHESMIGVSALHTLGAGVEVLNHICAQCNDASGELDLHTAAQESESAHVPPGID